MLTLILGGARSGKSRFAESLCAEERQVFYLATAGFDAADAEMTARIARHQNDRPQHWKLIEEPLEISQRITALVPEDATVLVDCATIWLANLMWQERTKTPPEIERAALQKIAEFVETASQRNVIVVSNEVGSGVVPDNSVGRSFRDLQGFANQLLAQKSQRVILVVAGLPLTLKG